MSADENEFERVRGRGSVQEVVDRLAEAVTGAGMTVFARIDHGANATEVGMELRPTVLLVFGNPRAGTVLMQDVQMVGLDLPLRALAWEDEAGQVWLTYQEPASLARRYGLGAKSEPVLAAIRDGMAGQAAVAAGTPSDT